MSALPQRYPGVCVTVATVSEYNKLTIRVNKTGARRRLLPRIRGRE